jgi:hypothetical protein
VVRQLVQFLIIFFLHLLMIQITENIQCVLLELLVYKEFDIVRYDDPGLTLNVIAWTNGGNSLEPKLGHSVSDPHFN